MGFDALIHEHIGNANLTDLGHLLALQQTAAAGTYVADNPRVCFTPAIAWGRRNDSYIEYNTTVVCISLEFGTEFHTLQPSAQ